MTETNKNDFNEQLIKHEWMHKCVTSIHLLHDGFESTWFLRRRLLLWWQSRVEYLLPVILQRSVLLISLESLSIIVGVRACVETTNAVCLHLSAVNHRNGIN